MKTWIIGLGCLGVVVVLALVIGLSALGVYNGLVSQDEEVNKAWAQVQTVYQRRADLIPNLVATVKGAANFEQGTLTAVTEARAKVGSIRFEQPPDQKQLASFSQAQGQLSSAIARLLVSVERYPELKATQAFRDLSVQLEGTENRITVERQRYNESVQMLNGALRRFPGLLFAGAFSARSYFEAKEGSENAPAVNFDRL